MPEEENYTATPEKCTGIYERLFMQAIDKAQDSAAGWGFLVGFVAGQAEKVFNHVCRAAVFRATLVSTGDLNEAIEDVCREYGLASRTLRRGGVNELWIYRKGDFEVSSSFGILEVVTVNSPVWHTIRAELCGIPEGRIDHYYHERKEGV